MCETYKTNKHSPAQAQATMAVGTTHEAPLQLGPVAGMWAGPYWRLGALGKGRVHTAGGTAAVPYMQGILESLGRGGREQGWGRERGGKCAKVNVVAVDCAGR